MKTSVVILAAGEGTRMRSSLPKAMQFLAGKTMLEHVKHTADSLSSEQTIIVCSLERVSVVLLMCSSIVLPARGCIAFGRLEFILVPSPAAKITTEVFISIPNKLKDRLVYREVLENT